MTEAIQPQYLSLIELLEKRLFTIPDYQRSYSWSTRQRSDLFADIEDVWQEGGDGTHFMATVVCHRLRRVRLGAERMSELHIVDGQQRLTTLIILLNAIHYALVEEYEVQLEADKLRELLVKPHGEQGTLQK